MSPVILISTSGEPIETVERQLHQQNTGLYCASCGEFIALAVAPVTVKLDVTFESNEPIEILCPYCRRHLKQPASYIQHIILDENNSRLKW